MCQEMKYSHISFPYLLWFSDLSDSRAKCERWSHIGDNSDKTAFSLFNNPINVFCVTALFLMMASICRLRSVQYVF